MADVDEGLANLRSKIDHIVVLMLENRSFDHMLGYLSLEGGREDVDGLQPGMSNTWHKEAANGDGKVYEIHPAQGTTLKKIQDPSHSWGPVHEQLKDGNAHFVDSYMKTRPPEWRTQRPRVVFPSNVMAYHTAAQLPVYDFLAENFCVCDRWFCSVPGPTIPNRLYSICGTSGGHKDGKPSLFKLHTFVRHLDKAHVSWSWFIHSPPPMVWVADAEYALFHGGSIAWFKSHEPWPWFHDTFMQRAAANKLPAVSWIEPLFVDVVGNAMPTNDDHPPSDIRAGQELVLSVYSALAHSEAWNRTMLVITYDEHGGFYDHFDPTTVPPPEDDRAAEGFNRYGPRVPAIVVSPWVEPASTARDANGERIVFDHTSLIRTILERFCRHDDGSIPKMGKRVDHANHLGHLLTRDEPRKPPPFDHVLDPIKEFRGDRLQAMVESHAEGALGGVPDLSDFQKQLLAARESLLAGGAFNRYYSQRTSLHGQLAPAAPGQHPPGEAPPPPPELDRPH
jgi:phospholipase C